MSETAGGTRAARAPGREAAFDWAAVRARYPVATNSTFLNITSGTPLSNAARAAVEGFVRAQWAGAGTRAARPALLASARARVARLVRARAGEIAVTKNVTEGLNIVANAIDWRAGDNVVACTELEHPNNIYLWLELRRRGIELRAPRAVKGAIDTRAMIDAVDARTRLVTASSVTFAPGFRAELEPLGRACRRAGALFLVDGVQSCGILDLDVDAAAIDALATSTGKGLMGLPGLGFLYVRADWIERLRPAYIGRYSIERGTGHESEFEEGNYEFLRDARRFEAGNYNFPGIAAAEASLVELLEIGTHRIEPRVVRLATALADGLEALGLAVTSPPEILARSHIVTAGRLGAGDAAGSHDARLNRIGAALAEAGVRHTFRKGLLRFGFHCYNDDSDVARVLDVVRATP
ncbi:MAG: aminotransferase class V-fold PLP-dependent enzyme [Burkholderiales bacterium]|nr:aminotransferase class V-fold PLP-dependent enzyme [Burkholderiales bacterium]